MLNELIVDINQIKENLEKSVVENARALFELVIKLIIYQEQPNEIASKNMRLTNSYREELNETFSKNMRLARCCRVEPKEISSTKMGLTKSFFELPEIISRKIFLAN